MTEKERAVVEAAKRWRLAFLAERAEDNKAARYAKDDAEERLSDAVRETLTTEGRSVHLDDGAAG